MKKDFKIDDIDSFINKALVYANKSDTFFYLNNNHHETLYGSFKHMLAFGISHELKADTGEAFENLKQFSNEHFNWMFGYFTYDLKNETESLNSSNPDQLGFPDLYFFIPQNLIFFEKDTVSILAPEPDLIFDSITNIQTLKPKYSNSIYINKRLSRNEYLNKIKLIKDHIIEGDVYEMNFCMEFYAENSKIDPLATYLRLNRLSPMPFSALMKQSDKYVICASPERFIKKIGHKLISQPIKGTAARSRDKSEDEAIIQRLRTSEKELAENMMIVDLVRNDLAKSSITGSTKAEELFGIYSFENVHQMISTIVSEIDPDVHFIDAIKNAFPMGSMTGAPKIRAMELIDKFENSRRGLFSGALGYINPEKDFDFNVLIRSIFYDSTKEYLSYQTGSAITFDSDPESEYNECILKGAVIAEVLNNND